MAESDRPNRFRKSPSKEGEPAVHDLESVDGINGIAKEDSENDPDKNSIAREAEPEKGASPESDHHRRTESTTRVSDGLDSSEPPAQGAMPIYRRRWLYPAVAVAVLVSAGFGGGVIYLSGSHNRDEIKGSIETLEAGFARYEAELLERSTRIDGLEANLGAAENRIAGLQTVMEAESDRITVLQAENLEGDASAATRLELRDIGEALRNDLSRIDAELVALRERIESVEAQPIPITELPEEIVDAYDRQLAEMLDTVDERFSRMQSALDAGMMKIEARIETATLSEQDAKKAENAASARESLAKIVAALNSGAVFATELDVLQAASGARAPEALKSVADKGVPTRDELTAAFPEAARAALNAATEEAGENGDIGPVGAFLRRQLGIRSLEPREGNSPDAVLSRAEAAVRTDDLNIALSEIATLPESGRTRFAEWIGLAERRRDALDAIADLSARLGD